jgi:hypothetical protein
MSARELRMALEARPKSEAVAESPAGDRGQH